MRIPIEKLNNTKNAKKTVEKSKKFSAKRNRSVMGGEPVTTPYNSIKFEKPAFKNKNAVLLSTKQFSDTMVRGGQCDLLTFDVFNGIILIEIAGWPNFYIRQRQDCGFDWGHETVCEQTGIRFAW